MPNPRAKTLSYKEERDALRKPLVDGLREGQDLFRAGKYRAAAAQFASMVPAAVAAGQRDLAARAKGNIGGCQFALHQYQPALRSFLDARLTAQSEHDASAVAAFDANIASLLTEMGDFQGAAQLIGGTLEHLSLPDRKHMPKLLLQMAIIRARQQRMNEAIRLFYKGIDAADAVGDLEPSTGDFELSAIGWNRLGEEFYKHGDFADAEGPLLEAFRIRKLHHLALDSSYRNLGRLRLAQGDIPSASALLDRAVELTGRSLGPIPTWDIYFSRGRVRLAQGRLREALADLRIAVNLARAWRWSAPAEDATRIYAEGWLDPVHSALIEAGNRLYLQSRNPDLVRETFEAAEENRASSLRALFAERRTAAELPPSYWEAVDQLQRAEVQALRTGTPAAQDALRTARAGLIRLESALSPAFHPPPTDLLKRTQSALDSRSAMLSFHLGDSISWLWALDRHGIVLYSLPPRKEIESQIQAAVRTVRDRTAAAEPADFRLYHTLFGLLAPRFLNKTRWLLALDEALFDVPVAALRENLRPRPVYLAERHVTEVIPGAGYWLEVVSQPDAPPSSTVFLGIGDPIYNAADPRLPPRTGLPVASVGSPWRLLAATGSHDASSLVLPRLVASGQELDVCARAWSGESILLKGAAATARQLSEKLRIRPRIVHFATHFLGASSPPFQGSIALSLNTRGQAELLGPLEISRWRTRTGVVVLSGCRSAAGAPLLKDGLIGLTRAWLMAGAQSVVGSRWDTPDETGAVFTAFYRNLHGQYRDDPATALRAAQLEMLRSGDWRADPSYWGAYFAVGTQ